jgi:DNA-binding NarL/FixJ family response regulator
MRIVLVDDHPYVRDGTAALLKALGHIVVGEASDGDEGVRVVRATRPQLVLMDLHMPVMDGIEATRILKAEYPAVKVLILTASDDAGDLREAMRSGADGYLLKDTRAAELLEAIDAVGRDEMVISAEPAVLSSRPLPRAG